MHKLILALGFAVVALSGSRPAEAAAALPRLKIDPSQTTVSGLSSGGFMKEATSFSSTAAW